MRESILARWRHMGASSADWPQRGFDGGRQRHPRPGRPGASVPSRRNSDYWRALFLLDRLPSEFREVLLLRVVTGRSAEETGQALGVPVERVRVMQYEALTLLRAMVKDDEAPA